MRNQVLGTMILAVALASFAGCGGGSGGNTGGSSTSSTHHTGGSGGTGTAMCTAAADCGADTDCRKFSCEGGTCKTTDVAAGTAATDQTQAGDCKKTVCDGMGATVAGNDDADAPDDGTACTVDACSNGTGTHTDAATGTVCNDEGGKKCDGKGKCVECLAPVDCTGGALCQQNKCVPSSCGNNTKDGTETDKDCGGLQCAACADGLMCVTAADCASGVCKTMVCQAPACNDNVKNGTETDKDCGGPSCPDCPNGETCKVGSDCQSGVCSGTPLECQDPTCSDGVANGGESDVDCAGPCAKKCGPGSICAMNADCAGGQCNQGTKTCTPTCSDGVKNNAETDVDCGGGTCGTCAVNKTCAVNGDCASGMCTGNVCSQVNGCDLPTAMDLTSQPSVTITFPNTAYSTPCIKVKVGTMVTFSGSFGSHPLKAGQIVNGVEMPAAAGTTPLPTAPGGLATGNTATFTMTPVGTYPYYCTVHYDMGMLGAIFVVP